MTSRFLSEDEWAAELWRTERTALRLEQQPAYAEPGEAESVAAFLAGAPTDPLMLPGATEWATFVRRLVSNGGVVERVRIQKDPPTGYQRWERWLDGVFNRPAGELIRYMTVDQAEGAGLLGLDRSRDDWWLLDDSRLLWMGFDDDGRRTTNVLVDDADAVEIARRWWDLAVTASQPLDE